MRKYVTTSLETHLFFGRIMKEHALFLLASFPAGETEYRKKADWFREEFEKILQRVVWLANRAVREEVLSSGEVVTEFTELAERQTANLTGIPIDIQITQAEQKLKAGISGNQNRRMMQQVQHVNRKTLSLLNQFIAFKQQILCDVQSCKLYTTNYPLLIEHIMREAKLYQQILNELQRRGNMPLNDQREVELFWNQIMMEHAQFIRGLLDPTECELIEKANTFAQDYCRLLEEAQKQDAKMMDELTKKSLETTIQYRDFKAAGAEGITGCNISSIILPLLADHVLREANHYLRILKTPENGGRNG